MRNGPDEKLVSFLAKVPPSRLMAFMLVRILGVRAETVAETLLDRRLEELLDQFAPLIERVAPMRKDPPDLACGCVAALRSNLSSPFSGRTENGMERDARADRLIQRVGASTLRDYCADEPARDVAYWAESTTHAVRVHQAAAGDEWARAELIDLCRQQVKGGIRAYVFVSEYRDEIESNAWLAVLRELPRYDPARATFRHFVRVHTRYAISTFFKAGKQRSRRETRLVEALSRGLADSSSVTRAGEKRSLVLLLRVVFGSFKQSFSSSPPHQLVGFGYHCLLGWANETIIESCSEERLRSLGRSLSESVFSAELDDESRRTCFAQFLESFEHTLAEVVHPAVLRHHETLKDTVVGDVLLEDFYTTDPMQNIAQWCNKVKARSIGVLREMNLGRDDFGA